MAGLGVFKKTTEKRKRAPRRAWTPEQEHIRQQNLFLQDLRKKDYDLYKQIMLRNVLKPSISLDGGSAAAPQDDLREKLVEMSLRQLDNTGPNNLKQQLELIKMLMGFAEAMPGRDAPTGVMGIVQEAIRSGPEYLAALKNAPAMDPQIAQLLVNAQQAKTEPEPTYSARNNPEPVPVTEPRQLEVPRSESTGDPVADLVARLVPLLDRSPAEAAIALADILDEAAEANSPALPIIEGLIGQPIDLIIPLLNFYTNDAQYGPLARRLLTPEGQIWLRDVRKHLEQMQADDSDLPAADAGH